MLLMAGSELAANGCSVCALFEAFSTVSDEAPISEILRFHFSSIGNLSFGFRGKVRVLYPQRFARNGTNDLYSISLL